MEREGERMFLECLDQLQVATANLDEVSYYHNLIFTVCACVSFL